MKKGLFFAFCILSFSQFIFADKLDPKNKLAFTENKGQISDQNYQPRPDVLFGGITNGMAFHLRNNGISYQLSKVEEDNAEEKKCLFTNKFATKTPSKISIYRLDINWLNCNIASSLKKENELDGYNNYYFEACPNGVTNVKSYGKISYKNIYSGIDLVWYEKEGNLKYDYLVSAHANYKAIQLEFKGAEKIIINSKGELVISTPFGDIIEQAPLVTQNSKILKSNWVIKNNILSFNIEGLNEAASFIIDPIIRTWGTYYGGSGNDQGLCCKTDLSGNVFLAGTTGSGASIATVGSHQITYGGGLGDAFVSKFNSAGVRQWATFYGGSGEDNAPYCAVDATGNVYLTGYTNSGTGTVMATAGSHQPAFAGGYDAYLAKFNASGIRQWSTYYGGNNGEFGTGCAIDATGNVYLSGYASSTGTALATPGSHQPALAAGDDGFLAKFNSSGVRLWGTYYGGIDNDYGFSVSTDGTNVFLAGYSSTTSGTAIASVGSHQPAYAGVNDAFLVKFDAVGVRQWGTYCGGTGDDQGLTCATDNAGNTYISGYTGTNTGTAIASAGGHQPIYGGGGYDTFLVQFNTNGSRQWGTYYGGSGNDFGYMIATDAANNAYLAGYTGSNTGTVIATPNGYQPVFGGGSNDAFLVQFNVSGTRQWGTYYGGALSDLGYGCTIDASGNMYLSGNSNTSGGTTIATASSYQPAFGGGLSDGFLVQLINCNIPNAPDDATATGNEVICENNSATLGATGSGTLSWFATPTSTTVLGTGTSFVTPTLSAGVYTFYVEAFSCATSASRTAISVTVNVCSGIKNYSASITEFKVYPNPNTGSFSMYSDIDLSLNIINALGQIVGSIILEAGNNRELQITNLSRGIYFIHGSNGSGVVSKKIVVSN